MLCTQEPRTAPQGTARRVGILVRSLQITALGQLTGTWSQILWTCSILGIASCDVLWHHLRLVGHHAFSAHVLPFGIHNHLQLRLVPSLSLGWDECILDWRHSFMITSGPCFSTSIEEGPCPRFHLRGPFRRPSVGSESCLHLPSRLKYLPLRLAHFFLITSMIFCTQSVTINLEN